MCCPLFTARSAFLFAVPPTPSQGRLPWPASKYCHVATMLNMSSCWAVRFMMCLFCYWLGGESVRYWVHRTDIRGKWFDFRHNFFWWMHMLLVRAESSYCRRTNVFCFFTLRLVTVSRFPGKIRLLSSRRKKLCMFSTWSSVRASEWRFMPRMPSSGAVSAAPWVSASCARLIMRYFFNTLPIATLRICYWNLFWRVSLYLFRSCMMSALWKINTPLPSVQPSERHMWRRSLLAFDDGVFLVSACSSPICGSAFCIYPSVPVVRPSSPSILPYHCTPQPCPSWLTCAHVRLLM